MSTERTIVLYSDSSDMAYYGLTHTPKLTQNYLELIAENGYDTIYWRVSIRGSFDYPSQYEPHGWREMHSELIDGRYKTFDPLQAAIDAKKKIGIKLFPHVTMFDEGLIYSPEEFTRFAQAHPDYLMIDREGRKCPFSDREYGSALCYAYPEVREYRIKLLRELLAYDIDGIVLDFYRWRESYDPWGGIHYGYNQPVVESFKKKYGEDPYQLSYDDPRWLRHKCEDMTQFLREFKTVVDREKPGLGISSFVPRTTQLCLYTGLDLETWAKEGLIHDFGIFNRYDCERALHGFYAATPEPVGHPKRIENFPKPIAESFDKVPFNRVGKEELGRFRALVGPQGRLLASIFPGRCFQHETTGHFQIKLNEDQFDKAAQGELADGADGIIFDEDATTFHYFRSIRKLAGRAV